MQFHLVIKSHCISTSIFLLCASRHFWGSLHGMRSTLAAELEVAGNIMFGEVEIPFLAPPFITCPFQNFHGIPFHYDGLRYIFTHHLPHPTYIRRAVGWYCSNIPCSSPGRIRGRLPHHWVPTILSTARNRFIITPIHVAMWMVYLVDILFL